jgi:CheY-like chemotaxis protein
VSPTETARVLVVDDRAPKRYLLVSWLTRAGYSVTQAQSGYDALEKIEKEPFDLVVLDVRLPDISGLEVCHRIKDDPRYGSVAVVHVSAHAVDAADRTTGLVGGADAYLTEPIDPHELVATVQAVLRYYRARKQAEELADGLARLAETTLAVTTAETFGRLLTAAAGGTSRLFNCAALVATEAIDGEWVAARATGPEEVTLRSWHPPPEPSPIGSHIVTGPASRWGLPDWDGDEEMAVATARLSGDRAPLYVAIPTATFGSRHQLLMQLAQALAAAAEAQRSHDVDHRIAITLQRSLLPKRLPRLPGVDLGVRYEPASPEAEVGGDFYELSLVGDELLIAIGDVVGHSLHAATVMAEIRYAIRAYAMEGHSPGKIVELIDNLMGKLMAGEFATLCLMLLDPRTGRARMANAGHLPPLLVTDGAVTQLTHKAPLLGLQQRRPPEVEVSIPPGSTLLLYTDGLIERRNISIQQRIDTLAGLAAEVDADLDTYCRRLVDRLSSPPIDDDIAVVAVRLHGRGDGES